MEIRNREPVLMVIVKKFTKAKVDLDIPVLAVHRALTKQYIISLTAAARKVKLHVAKEAFLSPDRTLILTHALLDRCTFLEDVQRGAGLLT